MSAARLYTPQMLAAAVELANYPPIETADLHGEARSKTCGSRVAVDLVLDDANLIERIGLTVTACAIGQGSAAILARHAKGCSPRELVAAAQSMAAWLEDDGPAPQWPDLALIAPARDYPARRGAMLAPWRAAVAALSSLVAPR